MKTKLDFVDNRLVLGTCYYPEHWSEELWEEDLLRMKENGIEIIRIAEFAWSKIEPVEGMFTYEFYDRFLEVAKKVGTKIIFCTPTATPPAWLTHKYPEVLNATMDGVLYRHGARRHYNYNSPKYLELCARICEKSAAHYASHPNIIGWQIDNEINCEKDEFYSESDTVAFRRFLQEKYGTLDALNQAWGTAFWNQTYTAWDEVYVPRTTLSNSTNPHEVLDYYRFVSDSACRFAKMQSDIVRRYTKPGDFVTTNGIFNKLDYQRMRDESLDFITYDSYPNFAYCLAEDPLHSTDLNDRKWSRNLTEVRAISSNFGIMEQQSGANGWNTHMEAPTPRPGQLTLWTMQSVAHGADYISYFRWRTCTMGTEIYWHGILDYSSRENRRLREVRQVYEKFKKLSGISGTTYEANVAVLKDYDNIFDSQLDVWHGRVENVSQKGLFQAAQLTHTPMDYVYMTDQLTAGDLAKYKVVFYPHAVILTKERMDVLDAYVKNGGCLVMGCRTGYKDMTGKCVMDYLPGLAQKLTATDIPEYSFVAPDEGKVMADWDGMQVEAAVFNDILAPLNEEAEVVGTYADSYYAGEPALIRHKYGKGETYYFGGAFSEDTAKVFLEKLGVAETYGSCVTLPQMCEVAVRAGEEEKYLFVLNYAGTEQRITLHHTMYDCYEEKDAGGEVTLAPYETKVYRM